MTSAKAKIIALRFRQVSVFCGPERQWIYPYFKAGDAKGPRLELGAMLPVNLLVTFLVLSPWARSRCSAACAGGIPNTAGFWAIRASAIIS